MFVPSNNNDMSLSFIQQTANDYKISFEIVKNIYEKYGATLTFYEKLEEIIKQRSL